MRNGSIGQGGTKNIILPMMRKGRKGQLKAKKFIEKVMFLGSLLWSLWLLVLDLTQMEIAHLMVN